MRSQGWFLGATGLGSGPGSGGLSQHVLIAVPLSAGPAESLFKESYYQLMKTALKEDGILCCQGERRPSSQRR